MLSVFRIYIYSYIRYFTTQKKNNDKIYVVISMMSNIVGNNIRKLRKKHGMNQKELAEKLNIRRQTVSAYEREVSIPDIYTLIRIADIFSVSLDELAGRNSGKKKKPWEKEKALNTQGFSSMRKMGLEPTRHECHKILSLARLPVPTLPHFQFLCSALCVPC